MSTTPQSLSVTTLTIYLLLTPPTLFCLYKHGLPGSIGWSYLLLFCLVRVTSSAISIPHPASSSRELDLSTTALLLSNLGLSPLLLAAAGLLHECRMARDPGMPKRLEWMKIVAFHAFVLVSILLFVIGWVQVKGNVQASEQVCGFMKIGIAGFLICGCMLASWVFASWDLSVEENFMEAPAHLDGTRILQALLYTLPFLFLRGIYAALAIFLPYSRFHVSLVAKLLMFVIPEIVLVIAWVFVGIVTMKMTCRRRGGGQQIERVVADIYPQDDEVVWEPKFD